MSSKSSHYAQKVLERIKEARGFKTDTQLAEYLGVGTSTVSTWKRRNSFDFRLILSKCENIDLNWLFLGQAQTGNATAHNQRSPVDLKTENQRLHDKVTLLEGRIEGLREALRLMGVQGGGDPDEGAQSSEAERRRSGEEETGFTATEGADADAV